MNRHLNVFAPYSRAGHHEDQLTRALLITLETVPSMRDAFLSRIGEMASGRLPQLEVDMQTPNIAVPSPDGGEVTVDRLVSVFVSPDLARDFTEKELVEREREQRLDGVLRFGSELIVVIECKLYPKHPDEQAWKLKLRGLGVAEDKIEILPLAWHDLLEDALRLIDQSALGPAELKLVDDLISLVEGHHPDILPFRTLGMAGENDLRVSRRLESLLRKATGLDSHRANYGAQWADTSIDSKYRSESFDRFGLFRISKDSESLNLAVWPAEKIGQARSLFGTSRSVGASDLIATDPAWTLTFGPSLSIGRFRSVALDFEGSASDYLAFWRDNEEANDYVTSTRSGVEAAKALKEFILRAEMLDEGREIELDEALGKAGNQFLLIRPKFELKRSWKWADALELDEEKSGGTLVGEISDAVAQVCAALDEPIPWAEVPSA